MRIFKHGKGLAFKLILFIFTSIGLIFSVVFLYNYHISKGIVEKNLRLNAEILTKATVVKVDKVLSTVQIISDNFSQIIESQNLSDEEMINILRLEVSNNPEIFGATLAFEPDFHESGKKYYAPYFYRNNGKIDFKYLGNEKFDYFTKDWYQIPKKQNKPAWSEPYYHEEAGTDLMSTYSVPIYRKINGQKRFIGVLTADISLNWLQEFMNTIQVLKTGYGFVISTNGTYVSHPVKNMQMNETIFSIANVWKSPKLGEIGRNMINGKSGFAKLEYKDIRIGKPGWIAYTPIPLNKWSVGIVFPVDEFMADVNHLYANLIFLGLGGLVFLLLVIVFISKSITSPLRTLELDTALNKANRDLEAARVQLVQSEKMASLGQLTAGIAHEIKNPLNFINNFAELTVELADELSEEITKMSGTLPEKDQEYFMEMASDIKTNAQKINEHGKRADSIIRGMLLHSRGKAGDMQLTDVNALLAEYVSLGYHGMRAQDSSFNLKIETDYDPGIGSITVVPQNISRVFLNIINNACYSTNQKSKELKDAYFPVLSVQTQNLENIVEIRIRDNGKGIPREIIDNVFDPFFTTKPAGQGTGLGLSLSFDIIVKEHHGEMKVESKVGEFAEFIIRIPKDLK